MRHQKKLVLGTFLLAGVSAGLILCAEVRPATQPATAPATQPVAAKPSPELSPTQVVEIVVEALKHNAEGDAGIATVFEFASPANKAQTGPLQRFIPLVKSPAYAPMINCTASELGKIEVDGNVARQFVKLTSADGTERVYVFILSKQTDAPYTDCWMTDGVMPVLPAGAEEEPAPGLQT